MRSRRRRIGLVLALAAGGVGLWSAREPLLGHVAAAVLGADYLGQDGVRRQRGEVDCGVAVLEMIFAARGVPPARLSGTREAVLGRGRGLSLLEMQQIALRHGLDAAGYRMNMAGLAAAPLPAVAHFPDHFVVVDRVTSSDVELRDPAVGRLRMPRARFQALWSGRTIVFTPPHRGQRDVVAVGKPR